MTDFRITFSKTGPLVFISHLDLSHTFVRAFNRAGIKMRYSEGFNPHPKLVFALPLSVGMAGTNELCDVGLKEDMDIDTFREKLTKVLPEHLEILDVSPVGAKFKNVVSADYTYTFDGTEETKEKINKHLSNEKITVVKRTKSGEKETDIKPQIFSAKAETCDRKIALYMNLESAPDHYLNPEYVIKSLEDAGILAENTPTQSVRTRIYLK